jgi:hypothetical protein
MINRVNGSTPRNIKIKNEINNSASDETLMDGSIFYFALRVHIFFKNEDSVVNPITYYPLLSTDLNLNLNHPTTVAVVVVVWVTIG